MIKLSLTGIAQLTRNLERKARVLATIKKRGR